MIKKIRNIFIIFKPHPNADLKQIKQILKELNFLNYEISYTHVSVLACICKYTICNYFSLAIPDAWFAKSITIELSQYDKEILHFTKNNSLGSEYVDYFVDIKNEKKLIKIFKSKNSPKKNHFQNRFNESFKNNLLRNL